MKKNLHNVFLALALILLPTYIFAQAAPNLGTTSSFAFFSGTGAFSAVGATAVTGDVGTHTGAFSGFPPGVLVGTKHVADPTSALASADVLVAYGDMSPLACGTVLGTPILTQTLTPGVYCAGGASVLAGDLTLDGGGDPAAKFYFKINGALATNNSTKIILTNGAKWSNVYWQINGAFTGGNSSVFMGTILAQGAITFNGSSTLYGRGLSTAGAINLNDMTGILPPPLTVSTTQVNPGCFGSLTGSSTATAAGGVPPYSYSWNTLPAQNTATATGLAAGNYIVTVTDNAGSIVTANVTITQPLVLALTSAVVSSPILCNGGTATVTIVANGGTAPYSYTFNGSTNNTGLFNGVSAGLNKPYSITDASNCGPVTGTVNVTQPLVLALNSAAITSPILCNGGTATVSIVANGGTPPYSYTFNGATNSTGLFTGVSPGLNKPYSITDASNCGPLTGTINVTQPQVLALTSAAITSPILCNGGGATVTIVANGGTPPYKYTFDGRTNNTGVFNGVLTGLNKPYSITDASNCGPVTGNLSITGPAMMLVSTTQTNVKCFGNSSASATALVQGGSAPYRYSWNTIPVQTTATANNLSAGNYMVTVTDNSGCMGTANVIINQPAAALVVNTMKTDVLCFGDATGSATATPQGGSAPYSYSWNTIPVQTTATINNLRAGNYMVTVTDNSGCIATANVIINQPLQGLMVNPIQTNVLCFGQATGSATAIPTGGTPPYTYLWNTIPAQTTATVNNLPAGNYTVRVTDSNGCIATANVSITQPQPITGSAMAAIVLTGQGGTGPLIYTLNGVSNGTGIFTNIESGVEYNWSITDANNCQVAAGKTGLCLNPLALIVIDKVNVLCFNGNTGSIKVEASGGDAPYEYKLNNSPYQVSGTFNSLTAGAYTVTVRDAKGKTSDIPVTITQPSLLTVSTIQTNILCEGEATGSASALAQGGTAPYSYSWNTLPVKTTVTATGLTAGTYSVRVTDANGCTATAPVTIVASNSLPTTAFTSSPSGLNTYTFVNASVNATSYAWDFGDGQASTIANPIHVYATAGTYTVKLTVANSCGSDIETQVLTVPELEFFNGFSPNGDGQNDDWNIPILNYYPVNDVTIINRWGSEVWKGINYDNKTVVWTGKNMKGEDMPDGTYYYIINYDNTEKRGWVFIKR